MFTVWGEDANKEYTKGEIIFVKGRVDEYNGSKNLGLGFRGSVDLQPDSEDAIWLYQWMNAQGGNVDIIMDRAQKVGVAEIGGSSVRKSRDPESLDQIYQWANSLCWDASNNTSYHDCPSWYVTFVKHDSAPFYMACTAEVDSNKGDNTKRVCNKKVEFDS